MFGRLVAAAPWQRSSSSHTRSSFRTFATRRAMFPNLPRDILDALPDYEEPEEEQIDTSAFPYNPINSAHLIDVAKQELSKLDSVAINPADGSIVHGRYGPLGDTAAAIPLEYLALLHPAAQGAAALKHIITKASASSSEHTNTILIYNAASAPGLAATQLAASAGHAVVAVVGGDHAGSEDMMDIVQGLVPEPGVALTENYALSKRLFRDMVKMVCEGGAEGIVTPTAEQYVEEFKTNLLEYVEFYPDTRPAAVSPAHVEFKYMEKDRAQFDENMAAYLEQFPPGAPPISKALLEKNFDKDQYEIFRQKFWHQTTAVISGSDADFSAPHIVKAQIESPESLDNRTHGDAPYFPYAFSILNQSFPPDTEAQAGGPVAGAIIVVSTTLKSAAEKIAKGQTIRDKGEVLAFLTEAEKGAFGSACSVAAQARAAGAPVVVVGGTLPGLETIEATEADAKDVLQAMDIDEEGESRLNYFVQAYRANDFPFYEGYAIHRAGEPMAGPRQFVVTK